MTVTSNPYCQLSDVKSLLGITSTANDTWIQSLIPQAQQLIDRELGYAFQQDGTTQSPTIKTFNGRGRDTLFVGYIQQIVQVKQQINSLTVGFDGFFNIQTNSVEDITQDCVIGPANEPLGWAIERLSGIEFYTGRRNYTVSGVWGWSSIPADITRACARLAGFYVKMRDTNYADTVNEQGGIRQSYVKTIPEDVCTILDNYKLTRFYG